MSPWLFALAGAALLLLLALKLRGPRAGRDLPGPPRPKPFTRAEAERIGGLVARGEEAEALRLMRAAGHDEAGARKVIDLIARLGAAGGDEPAGRRGG